MNGLNIHFHSFQLNKEIVNKNDIVAITVTSFPDHNTSTFTTFAKKYGKF